MNDDSSLPNEDLESFSNGTYNIRIKWSEQREREKDSLSFGWRHLFSRPELFYWCQIELFDLICVTLPRFDSLTGVPSAQRTVAFEKACVLFNLGALHTQIGTRQERGTGDGLDGSVDNFLRAAAVFRFIVDNFTNAPSMDLAPEVLEAFILLMMVRKNNFYDSVIHSLIIISILFRPHKKKPIKAQARECLFEKLLLSNSDAAGGVTTATASTHQDIDAYLEQAQEATEVRTTIISHHYHLFNNFFFLLFNSFPNLINESMMPYRLNWSRITYRILGSPWYK